MDGPWQCCLPLNSEKHCHAKGQPQQNWSQCSHTQSRSGCGGAQHAVRSEKEARLPVRRLFTPNQVPLAQFLWQHQANSTWHPTTLAEILQQDVLEHDLQLTPALAWLCYGNTRRSFSRSSGCPGPDISVQCPYHTAGFRSSQTLSSQSSLEKTDPQL